MAKAIEMSSIDICVKSEMMKCSEKIRTFEYKLSDKSSKSKLIKGAKREPFVVVEKSVSTNLIFSVGAWDRVVLPSVRYWEQVQETKAAKLALQLFVYQV